MVACRGLHGHERHELQQVILEHVAETARFLVISAPMPHAECLSGRDLHVIDVLTMPDRLDDRVGKPKREDILTVSFPR